MEFCLLIDLPWEFYSFVKYLVMNVLHELPAKSQKGLFKLFSSTLLSYQFSNKSLARKKWKCWQLVCLYHERQVLSTHSIDFFALCVIWILRNEYERKISHTKCCDKSHPPCASIILSRIEHFSFQIGLIGENLLLASQKGNKFCL